MNGKTIGMMLWTSYDTKDTLDLLPIDSENQSINYSYNGMDIECRISMHPTKGIPVIWCDNKHKNILPLAIHHSICQVFNLIDTIQIYVEFRELSDFPKINRVDNLREYGFFVDKAEDYEDFFEKVEITNYLQVSYPYANVRIKEDSKLLLTKHLGCDGCFWLTMNHLMNFNGKTVVNKRTRGINSYGVIDFLNNWMKGGNPNLEMMLIVETLSSNAFDASIIQKNFNFKPWDPKKRGSRFTYTALYPHVSKTDILDCTNAMDLERKTDNKLATVKIEKESFIFFVWNDPFPISVLSDVRLGKDPKTGEEFHYYSYGKNQF
ncbi:hypothetical protein GCK72_009309 [Caenorhabditis remanei]|uniref:Sdz-33 F-box domain-containing protein n=1 Tax=Caenorhabditis remanei TaxID=31234 RepID=A0A6A5H282_CAERE|nr:hypothetical protein GCK72_009309 [Caenorhabditis remanei]KAF1761055.1 hypothetical protein GCK72_009309 [Caenorhabditis remanei]